MGLGDRLDQRLGILGDVTARVLEQRYCAIDPQRRERRLDFFSDDVGIFPRHDARVDKNIAKRTGPVDPATTANFHDLRLGNDRTAGKFHGLAFFVGDRPCFDGRDNWHGFDESVGIFLDGSSPFETRRINFSPLYPYLVPARAALRLHDAEARGLANQRVIRDHTAIDDPLGAEPLAGKIDALLLIHRRSAGLECHGGQGKIALQFDTALLDRSHGDHEGAELRLVVDHPFAEQHVAVDPGRLQFLFVIGRIGPKLRPGVHVRVPNQTLAFSAASKGGYRIDTLAGNELQLAFYSRGAKPLQHRLAELSFLSMKTRSVA